MDVTQQVEILAFFAGFCTTMSFVPQVIKTWKEKNVQGISLIMYLIFVMGVSLWFSVGYLLESPSMMLWNGVTWLLAVSVLVMKILYNKRMQKFSAIWRKSGQRP